MPACLAMSGKKVILFASDERKCFNMANRCVVANEFPRTPNRDIGSGLAPRHDNRLLEAAPTARKVQEERLVSASIAGMTPFHNLVHPILCER